MIHPKGLYAWFVEKALYSKPLKAIALPIFKRFLNKAIAQEGFPEGLTKKRQEFYNAVLNSFIRNVENGNISKNAIRKSLKMFMGKRDLPKIKRDFKKESGTKPPKFIAVAPTKKCNLKCIGCYAASTYEDKKLSYKVFDKLIGEAYNKLGQSFMVVIGGEPFLYQDKGKTIFDIWEKYPNMFFLV